MITAVVMVCGGLVLQNDPDVKRLREHYRKLFRRGRIKKVDEGGEVNVLHWLWSITGWVAGGVMVLATLGIGTLFVCVIVDSVRSNREFAEGSSDDKGGGT